MATEEDTYSTVFSVLKHPIRRRVLRMLSVKPHTYTEILKALNVETGHLNYHLENMLGLVTRDEHGRYGLSVFGDAAVGLITQIEEPVRTERKTASFIGVRLSLPRLLAVALVALLVSNIYLLQAYQGLHRERTNALGGTMIQTKGLLGEASNILSHTIMQGSVDFEVWEVMLKDLALQLRLYVTISELDPDHRSQWTQIRLALDEATTLFFHIGQKYEATSGRYLNLTKPQASSLESVLEGLATIDAEAFPQRIVLGADPEFRIDDESLTRAVEAAQATQAKVMTARIEFAL